MALRHGIFLPPLHTMDENVTLCLQRDLELIQHVDNLGFDEAWIGEHHSAGFETIDSPEIFIMAAAERTKRIRLGTGVVSLPYHHPLNVANRLIQLDHMTYGRLMIGFGPGLLPSDALMMGIEPEATRDRMAESVDVILRLLRGEVVTEATEWFALQEARTHLRPFQDPHPEICVASAITPSGAKLAGKYGFGLLCVAAGESAGFDALSSNWAAANEVAAQHGREMNRDNLRVVLTMHLAESKEQAVDKIHYGASQFVDYRNNNMPRWHVPAGTDPVDWIMDNDIAVVGTPDDAIERIERVIAKQGEFGSVLLQTNNWAPWEDTKHSLELYARYVIPHFRGDNVNRVDSYNWVTNHQAELVEKRNRASQRVFDQQASEREAAGLRSGARPERGKESW
jgi:limonene 1,2-monooxygenase